MNANFLIAVIGDVHGQIDLAVEGLTQIEQEQGLAIAQVFSVGDVGLFLEEEDWKFLTGPSKYRQPERSSAIRMAWAKWRWPLAMIAGNHEPFNRLRNWEPSDYEGRITYTHSGVLSHQIEGLVVAGLSGIYHPQETKFPSHQGRRLDWSEMVRSVQEDGLGRGALTYYKESEIEALALLKTKPHILLTHDWPMEPEKNLFKYNRRPEQELTLALQPQYHFAGHHHQYHQAELGSTRFCGLNIITTPEHYYRHLLPLTSQPSRRSKAKILRYP